MRYKQFLLSIAAAGALLLNAQNALSVETGVSDLPPNRYRSQRSGKTTAVASRVTSFEMMRRHWAELTHPVRMTGGEIPLPQVPPENPDPIISPIPIVFEEDGYPVEPDERARLIEMLAAIPAAHLKGLEKIILKKGLSQSLQDESAHISEKVLVVNLLQPVKGESDTGFLNVSLGTALGYRYFKNRLSASERDAWKAFEEKDEKGIGDKGVNRFALFYGQWLYRSGMMQAAIDQNDIDAIKAILMVSIYFIEPSGAREYKTLDERHTQFTIEDCYRTSDTLYVAGIPFERHGANIITGVVGGKKFNRLLIIPNAIIDQFPERK